MRKSPYLFFVAIAYWSIAARAQSADPASAEAQAVRPILQRLWAVELNPLALNVDRVSINFEVALGAHHALLLAPILQPSNGDIGAGIWGEFGYRFYSRGGGLQGFFVGPSLGAGRFSYYTDELSGAQRASSISVALDCGYQFALRSGVMLGFGFGTQYQRVQHQYEVRNDPINQFELESGVLPRLLFSVGYGQ